MRDERRGPDPNDPLVQTAVFGRMCEDFLKSEIGEYLLARALEEEEEHTKLLVSNAANWDLTQRVEGQAKIWRAQKFREWMADAINAGEQALNLGQEEEHG